MWPFRPRHTAESVLRDLAEGYAAGTVVLPETAPPADLSPGDIILIRLVGPRPAAAGRQYVLDMTPDEAGRLIAGRTG